MRLLRKTRYFLEDHLPFRMVWIAKLAAIPPWHWLKIFRRLDYRSMFSRSAKTANINNTTVRGIILEVYGPPMLATVLTAARALDMKLFLTYGTLLGHLRDGGFIKHDWDIDLGILEEDIPKMGSLMEAVERKGYLVARQSKHRMAFRDRYNLLHLDIDYYFSKGDTTFHHVFNVGKSDLYTFSYPKDIFRSFEPVQFLNKFDALIPIDSDRFLTQVYGDWRTPRTDQQPSDFMNITITKIPPGDVHEYLPIMTS